MKIKGLILTIVLMSCSPESPKLVPPRTTDVVNQDQDVNISFTPKVDILFVIDNSISMDGHQRRLRDHIDKFIIGLNSLIDIDYHVGVMTTDASSDRKRGKLVGNPKVIKVDTPDRDARLRSNMRVGDNGSSTEKPFAAMKRGLIPLLLNGDNAGFIRDDASLAVFIITDTEDQSDDGARDMYTFLTTLKGGVAERVLVYGAIIPSSMGSNPRRCDRDNTSDRPRKIEDLIALTGGEGFFLCDPDFGSKIEIVGENIANSIEVFVPLAARPQLSTVQVRFGNRLIPHHFDTGWSYDPARVGIYINKGVDLSVGSEGDKLSVTYKKAF